MGGFIEPNIHPVLVHFTYALGTSAALAYVAGLLVPAGRWRDSLRPAADCAFNQVVIADLQDQPAVFPSQAFITYHR